MNSKSPLLLTTASLVLAVVLSSCSGAALEKKATQVNALDNHLSVRGRVCTDPPDPTGFPVKVVMLVDQSGSMCISDPPGSQGAAGLLRVSSRPPWASRRRPGCARSRR